jgi:hypothetical protein
MINYNRHDEQSGVLNCSCSLSYTILHDNNYTIELRIAQLHVMLMHLHGTVFLLFFGQSLIKIQIDAFTDIS